MTRDYLEDIELVLLKRILLGKLNPNPDSDYITFIYSSIEDYANKGIDLLARLEILERELDIKIPISLYSFLVKEKDCSHYHSISDFWLQENSAFSLFHEDNPRYKKDSPFSERVKKICPWLFDTSITIKDVAILKEKINEFLNKYISDYESGELAGINVLSLQRHNDFFLKLFESLKNLDQRNLLIDSDILSDNLTNFHSSSVEAKGQMRLLEHFLLFEKQGYIEIKDIDFSEAGSKIPWIITITIISPLSQIGFVKSLTELKDKQSSPDSYSFHQLHFDEKFGILSYGDKSCEFSFNTAEYCILQAIFEKPKGKKLRKLELAYHYEEKVEKDTKDETIYQATLRINKKALNKLEINKLIEYENGLYWLKEF